MEQALPLLLPWRWCCQVENGAAHAGLLSSWRCKDGAAVLVAALVPASLTWIAVLGAWSCCRWRGRRCPAGAVNEVRQELSKPMLPCGEKQGWVAAGVMLLPMMLAESVLQARWSAAGAAVWRAAVLRRKRRATDLLARRGVCCRCCPSAVQVLSSLGNGACCPWRSCPSRVCAALFWKERLSQQHSNKC
jgi:hypothetical protein